MTQVLEEYARQCREKRPGSINAGMAPHLVDCDPDEGWLELKYEVAEWMRNLRGSVHGGAVSAMFDNAMGGLAWCVTGGNPCPTITLQSSFVRPLTVGTTVHVRATLTSGGRTLTYTEAQLFQEGAEERILATATGVYHTATFLERKVAKEL
jgi:uncharacterized protein (TIGR00369 family)